MPKVLIIEDDNSIAQSYFSILSHQKYSVQIAPDATTGLEQAAQFRPDVILLDMLMPGLSGLDFLRALDIKRNLPTTKLIVISNTESPKIVEEAMQLGASKYLLKVNYTPSQIATVVGEMVGTEPQAT